jgi:hypothetical protein
MNRIALSAVLVLAGGWTLAPADDPDWPNLDFTRHDAFQAIDAEGDGTFPLTDPVRMRGVILNRPGDMVDVTADAPEFLGGQWQIVLAAVDLPADAWDDADFGGTALWIGQKYGNLPFIGDPAQSYTAAEWVAEIARLNHDPTTGRRFRPGDLVELHARAPGLFHAGKTNINEQHTNAPEQDFDLHLLQPGFGLPAPHVITLADLKHANDTYIFDGSRQTGPERHQGSLVRITNVSFVDAGAWGPGATLTVQDATGRTFPVLLGRGRCFSIYAAPAPPFDILGILDQEDDDGNDGYKHGYRLWVMGYDGSAFMIPSYPADYDGDNDVDLTDYGVFLTCYNGPAKAPAQTPCDDADFDSDGDVDLTDYGTFLDCYNGPGKAPACP